MNLQRGVDRGLSERNTVWSWIEIEKEQKRVCARRKTIGRNEVRIAFDRFIQRLQCLEQRGPHVSRVDVTVDDRLRLKVELERVEVLGRTFFDFGLLLG